MNHYFAVNCMRLTESKEKDQVLKGDLNIFLLKNIFLGAILSLHPFLLGSVRFTIYHSITAATDSFICII